jgi:protein disulfide-isomerase A6
MKTSLILLGLLLVSVTAFYDGTGDVVKLTGDNFKEEVTESSDFWLVEFFAPWCGHCKKLTPEWERAAKGLKGIVKMGAVDMTTDAGAAEGIDV